MKRHIYRVTAFSIVAPHVLRIEFDDSSSQTIDFQPAIEGELFAPLEDISLFNQVNLDTEAHTIVWPNGADFDPATLHDWPEYETELCQRAKQWAEEVKKASHEQQNVLAVAKDHAKYGKDDKQ